MGNFRNVDAFDSILVSGLVDGSLQSRGVVEWGYRAAAVLAAARRAVMLYFGGRLRQRPDAKGGGPDGGVGGGEAGGMPGLPRARCGFTAPSRVVAMSVNSARPLRIASWPARRNLVPRMMTYEYWRHTGSREVWAVALDEGEILRACGPLDERDMMVKVLPYLPYRHVDAIWVKENRAAFRQVAAMSQTRRLLT